jgi:hypothetical protein
VGVVIAGSDSGGTRPSRSASERGPGLPAEIAARAQLPVRLAGLFGIAAATYTGGFGLVKHLPAAAPQGALGRPGGGPISP